ncbi:DUF4912 domain-containing protein [Fontisphaera persica]|uniref:DUF4912 domain-containing protein n=1 Tax=Fontisphaera persica TaxID=2974023 RepID=UPI0024BF8E2C|nr:DUF4912 domain-containing protein [Fontisphaera persica]WCJ60506.1 DUF4912 domain-containing protein [Fontisphaera persica]
MPAILTEGDVPPPPPAHGPGQKFALGPTPPPAHVSGGEPGELPEAYGTGMLLLTARDPHWLYAWWDFTAEQLRQFNRRAAQGHLTLRVFKDKVAEKPHTEVAVHPESRNWFVHVGKGGTRYVAQLGYYNKQRRWQKVAESEATFTPPDSLADDITARFATVPPDVSFERLVEIVKEAARQHLPLAQAISEIVQPQSEDAPAAGQSGTVPAELQVPGAVAPAAWTPEQEKALARMISIDAVRRVWIGSLEITELVRRRLVQELASQAAVPQPGGLGALASLASPFGGQPPGPKGFWFNVNAELVIYGATEPDASVTIAGRPIQLRPDGSFSYRFALPDGMYDLPIVAVSADKSEGRGADLHFSRRTEYQGEVGMHPQDPALQPPLPENL